MRNETLWKKLQFYQNEYAEMSFFKHFQTLRESLTQKTIHRYNGLFNFSQIQTRSKCYGYKELLNIWTRSDFAFENNRINAQTDNGPRTTVHTSKTVSKSCFLHDSSTFQTV